MTDKYKPQEIEPQWQQRWKDDGLYETVEDPDKEKYYFLTMLPYTSGNLHIGHWYAMTPSDAAARYKRMNGYNVFFPIGFDAFGLPAENAAIRRGIHPHEWTMSNVEHMRKQLRSTGAMWAWDREAISSLPGYYRWTQWFFLKLYDMGLAYRDEALVDWCPKCNTVLAREQVWGEDRHCERCNTPVIKKNVPHWKFRITKYADELLDFSQIDWPERVKIMQTHWIGRSEGADTIFKTERGDALTVFTTRPDTLWGATFMVLAPEHPLVNELATGERREAVEAYQHRAARQSEIERTATDKTKTGVFTGAYAINPVNGERIPIWIADYVMMTYGTGAIMAVPAHDERDFEFAIKFGLPIIPVIDRPDGAAKSLLKPGVVKEGFAGALTEAGIAFEERDGALYVVLNRDQVDGYITLVQAYIQPGCWIEVVGTRWVFIFDDGIIKFDSVEADGEIVARCAVAGKRTAMEMLWDVEFYRDVLFHAEYGDMINSGELSGTPGDEARTKVTGWLEENGLGKAAINYRLHDWLISRQRYWGAPIPMIHCPQCGIVPVPYEELPVLLPEDAEFLPTGESPLNYHKGFLHVRCPKCGGDARRETDTMDTFMCSSWYHYAYVSPYYKEGEAAHADSMPIDPAKAKYWLPVDQYTGGIEHATMHLLYTRFFTKAMRDMGLVDFDEPMLRLFNQGMVLGEDGEKMSKSRGNVISPDELVEQYGADTVRVYLMFFARWDLGGPWDSQGIRGAQRFMEDVWSLIVEPKPEIAAETDEDDVKALRRTVHQTIRKVSEDIESFSFNTAIAALMALRNTMKTAKQTAVVYTPAWDEAVESLLLLMAPFAPHITEELWARIGHPYSIHVQNWPQWDEEVAAEETITLIVQVNGRVRDRLEAPANIGEQEAREKALTSAGAQRYIEGKEIVKVVYVPGRLLNIVVK
ncbi:MAG: leucine--tRNA ligase [Anaerolineaceae bacterium 4572_32.1]|nr:MAG: leucine--tRNA ligase [Anaerolineaceae bacterium 4572_32.1]